MNSTEGCLVACINNYVWVDVSTGLFPKTRVLSDSYACIPCKSDYIRSGLVDKSVLLYSVWNFTGAVVPQKGSVLAQVCSDFSVRDWSLVCSDSPREQVQVCSPAWGVAWRGLGVAWAGLGPCLGGAWTGLHRALFWWGQGRAGALPRWGLGAVA